MDPRILALRKIEDQLDGAVRIDVPEERVVELSHQVESSS